MFNKVQLYGQFVLDDLDFQYLKMDFDSLMVKYGLKKERSYDKYSFWLSHSKNVQQRSKKLYRCNFLERCHFCNILIGKQKEK